jgi:protein-S-isoprenylcysteine O-methyltransferase Ste14
MSIDERKGRLYKILSNSYIFYFTIFFIGILFDLIFPRHFLDNSYATFVGFIFIICSSFFIFWIKRNAKQNKKIETKEDFMRGPYKYTSIPNHWAIFILILGFGIMVNAFFMVVFATFCFVITLSYFLKMQEVVLAEKYGSIYTEYRKVVKF